MLLTSILRKTDESSGPTIESRVLKTKRPRIWKAPYRKKLFMEKSKFKHIVLFGPPGVGKGAQAELLSQRYGLSHLSTGELIRAEINEGTPLGLKVKEAVERGEFADDETVLGIIMDKIDLPKFTAGFLLDGFPRTVVQAERLDELLTERNKAVDCALFFDAPHDVLIERLSGRRVCSGCGATYHDKFKRPQVEGVCDACQKPVIQRQDDSTDVYRTRLEAYQERTDPLRNLYQNAGVIIEIDANQPIDGVAEQVSKIVDLPAQS